MTKPGITFKRKAKRRPEDAEWYTARMRRPRCCLCRKEGHTAGGCKEHVAMPPMKVMYSFDLSPMKENERRAEKMM